jgi:IS5 family transposase
MDPVLAQIDQLLDDEELYQLIRHDLARRHPQTEQTGRNSTPVEVTLRMLAIKRLYGSATSRRSTRCETVWCCVNSAGSI